MTTIQVPLKSTVCGVKDCIAHVSQEETHVDIYITSPTVGAVGGPCVPPEALDPPAVLQSINHTLVKGYSENDGMPLLLHKEGIIDGIPVDVHPSGFVHIGEFTLTPDVLAKLRGES